MMTSTRQILALAILIGLTFSASSRSALVVECADGIMCCSMQENSFSDCVDVRSAAECPKGKSPYCALKVPKPIGAAEIVVITAALAVAVPFALVIGSVIVGSTCIMANLVFGQLTGNGF